MKKVFLCLLVSLIIQNVQSQELRKLTLEDIFIKQTFSIKTIPGLRSMNDGENYTVFEDNSKIVKYNYKTGEETSTVFNLKSVKNPAISSFTDYEFSKDETKILLTTEIKPIYRRSFTAKYYIWNSVTEELTPLSDKGEQQAATFSPDGERVAFVRENNIYIKNLKFGSESQATFDGAKNKIINGIPDWVYEEEFGFNKAIWWSPDSKFLAYIRFDESEVPEFSMTIYKGDKPEYERNMLYPGEQKFKYPKAGEKNSQVSVKVYEIRSKTSITVDVGKETDFYIPRLCWTPNSGELAVMKVNRRQNRLDLLYANPYTGDSRAVFTEKNEKYIEDNFYDAFTYLDDGRFVVTSERNGWSHLYLYDKNGSEISQLTNGNFDITAFYGFDALKKMYYYQGAAESPLRREVYYLSVDGKKKGKLSGLQGTNNAEFSKKFKYFVNHYSSSETPNLITLHEISGKQIRVLQDNTILKNTIQVFDIPKKEFVNFTTSEGILLNGYMIKPSGFNSSKKYPVLITQYSGPNSQQVTDSWGRIPGWNEYLAQEGFFILCVDPRGTAARGEQFRKITYLQMGKYESDDMVEAVKFLHTLPYVDKNNIGIWGWSYGGFMTCLSMAKGGSLFKAGIAVAPVTNWRFYDSVYTERYMRTPKENPEGYDENSPLAHAGKIKGRLLIVHGSADDNVHVQNTYEFTEKMVQAGIQFDMAIYTNRNHGIRGGNTTMHLYTRMTDFFRNELIENQ